MREKLILQKMPATSWDYDFTAESQSQAISALEAGQIILFPQLDFSLLPHESKFLSPVYAHTKAKNISLDTRTGAMRCGECSPEDKIYLTRMIERFALQAEKFAQQLFPNYQRALQRGRTSLRVVEISGRVSSYRKDDTRLHVDAFPATPNQGKRILRIFTNINPVGKPRVWRVGEDFETVARRFLPAVTPQWAGKALLLKKLKITKTLRTQYDHIMLQIHNRMKADLHYQKTAEQTEIHFAPASTWVVQTDHVSHAAMAGQHVLEQTFYLPVAAMKTPVLSPLRTLERLTGRQLS